MENLEQNQPQPGPESQPVSQPQAPEPKPRSPFLLSILLSLVMFILGGSLVFAYFTFLKPEKVIPQPTVSPSPITQPIQATPTDKTPTMDLVKKSLDTCGVSVSYPDKSFTKTKIKKPPTGEEVVNLYKWVINDFGFDSEYKMGRIGVIWKAEGGFDPSVGEGPLAPIEIFCYGSVPAGSLEEFKDYVVKKSENINFSDFKKYQKWGTEIYEISYSLIKPAWGDTHILNDYFVGKYDKMFIFVLGDKGYRINRKEFKGYWTEERIIESNVSDLNQEQDLIFDNLSFVSKSF